MSSATSDRPESSGVSKRSASTRAELSAVGGSGGLHSSLGSLKGGNVVGHGLSLGNEVSFCLGAGHEDGDGLCLGLVAGAHSCLALLEGGGHIGLARLDDAALQALLELSQGVTLPALAGSDGVRVQTKTLFYLGHESLDNRFALVNLSCVIFRHGAGCLDVSLALGEGGHQGIKQRNIASGTAACIGG